MGSQAALPVLLRRPSLAGARPSCCTSSGTDLDRTGHLLQSHWGQSDAEHLGRLLDELERKIETDEHRSEVLRGRLLGLDHLQAEPDRELAGTFG